MQPMRLKKEKLLAIEMRVVTAPALPPIVARIDPLFTTFRNVYNVSIPPRLAN